MSSAFNLFGDFVLKMKLFDFNLKNNKQTGQLILLTRSRRVCGFGGWCQLQHWQRTACTVSYLQQWELWCSSFRTFSSGRGCGGNSNSIFSIPLTHHFLQLCLIGGKKKLIFSTVNFNCSHTRLDFKEQSLRQRFHQTVW